MADQAGSQLAVTSIILNHPMIYEWNPDDGGFSSTGRKDGQFEVWDWPDDPDASMESRYAQHKKMEAFNSTMRRIYNNPMLLKSWRQSAGSTNITPDITTNKFHPVF